MTLKKFYTLVLIIAAFFLTIGNFIFYHSLKEAFLSLEKEAAKNVVKNVEIYFTKELNNLYGLAKDWGAWDDAYLFMQDKNPDFVSSNLTPDIFPNLKIDFLIYTYLDGKIKAGGLFDKDTEKIYVNKELLTFVNFLVKELSNKNLSSIKKLTFFMDKPLMVAVYPILKSDYTGPKKGYIFMGKFLTSEEKKYLSNLLEIKNFQILRSSGSSEDLVFLKVGFDEIVLEKPQFLNNKTLKIKVFYPVEKFLIKSIISILIITHLSIFLIFSLVIIFLFEKYFFNPLQNLLKEIDQVKKRRKSKLSSQYPTKEYKNLAVTINKALEELSIREKIYTAIAEKTENLILLFDRNENILFKNVLATRYFNSEELKFLIKNFLKKIKKLKSPVNITNEIQIKDTWFSFRTIQVHENLYLLIGQNITKIKVKEEELFNLATHDFLTNLYNRRYFEDVLERTVAASKRGEIFSLLFIDCDNLKIVNDTYGHLAGDEVLKTVARIIEENLRKEDIAARWGGDEFVVILNHCNKDCGIKIAQRILENLEKSEININSNKIKASVSIGLVEIDGTKEINEILDLADKLAYEAKRDGKNKIKTHL
ncbi:MAG: diguanylate cyclase [Thermodesulfobacterium sp.]|nr:diguanylate cyclase [Thermodesulfobacterium sp.]